MNGTCNLNRPKRVRLLLLGDAGVGKTCLILSLVQEDFPKDISIAKLENILIPGEVNPEHVPTLLVDFSFREQTEADLDAEIVRADVICIVSSLVDSSSKERVSTYWLPKIRTLLGKLHTVPIVLVGNKSDLLESSEKGSYLEECVPIIDDYNEVETVIECSARTMNNLPEMFYYAQKAVLHPFAPLFDLKKGELSEKCVKALKRIFAIADINGDGLWSEDEMQTFQERVFRAPLLPAALSETISLIASKIDDGIKSGCITLSGFLYLNLMFVQRGRHEATWNTLRAFGYDDSLELTQYYKTGNFSGCKSGETIELSDQGMSYIMWLFSKYDRDKDDMLSPNEFYQLLNTCSTVPFGSDVFNSVETNSNGFITRKGFQALWALVTHSNPALAIECFAYFGYQWQMSESTQLPAFKLTRDRSRDLEHRQIIRNVLSCNIVGDTKAGKTQFCQSLIGKTCSSVTQIEPGMIPDYTVHPITVYRQKKFLVLQEVRTDGLDPRQLKSDATCFVFDSQRPESLEYVIEFYKRYKTHFDDSRVPCLFVAMKSDLRKNVVSSKVLERAEKFLSLNKLPGMEYFSAKEKLSNSQVYSILATLAMFPNIKPTFKVMLSSGTEWVPNLNLRLTPDEFKAAAAISCGSIVVAGIGYWVYSHMAKRPRIIV